jgi:hypothetical protein
MKASPTTGLAAPTHPTQGGAEQEHQESRGDPGGWSCSGYHGGV